MNNEKIQKAILETQKHIDTVYLMIEKVRQHLVNRMCKHDASKLETPELETFCVFTEKLAGSTYGSDEYKQFLKDMKPALDHHYENNSHHPEHYENGIDGMNLIDIIEMFCDWKAATMRHDDGDLNESIKINTNRFGISRQLENIFKNSVDIF